MTFNEHRLARRPVVNKNARDYTYELGASDSRRGGGGRARSLGASEQGGGICTTQSEKEEHIERVMYQIP